eukprot:4476601-Amphidinium_carterae.1
MRLDVTPTQQTRGIGGKATILSVQQIPIGVSGVAGLLTVQVLDQELPLLLHVGFLRGLGCVLNLDKLTCTWARLGGRCSPLQEAPSGHLLISILDVKHWSPPSMNLHVGCTTKSTPVEIWMNSVASGAQAKRGDSHPVLHRLVHVGPQRSSLGTSSATSWRIEASCSTGSESRKQPAGHSMLGSSSTPPTSLVARVLTSEEGIGSPPDSSLGRHAESVDAEQGEQEGDHGGAVPSGERTDDGKAVAAISGEDWNLASRFVRAPNRSTQAAGQCSRSLVDVPGLWIPLGADDLHGATPAFGGKDAMWQAQGGPIRSDPGELQTMGNQRVRAGWRQYGTPIAEVLSLGLGGRSGGSIQTLPVGEGICSTSCVTGGAGISDGRRRGDDPGIAHHRDIEKSAAWQGAVTHPPGSLPRTVPGPSRAQQEEMLHALRETLVPKQARRHADAGARGFLLGLYTQQGGTGVTKATWKYRHILKMILALTKQLHIEFTSVQVNVLEKGDLDPGPGVSFHRDLHNLKPSENYVLVLGQYKGGRVWAQDDLPHGVFPSTKLLGVEKVPSDVRGRWIVHKPGEWIVINPHAFHAVEPVTAGVRFSLSVHTSGGLHRVLPHQWSLLHDLGFPVQGLTAEHMPMQVLLQSVSLYKPRSAEEVTAVLTRFEELPPNMLRSGEVDGRACLWLATARDVSASMQRSLKALQDSGLVLWKVAGYEAYEHLPEFREVALQVDMDMQQFPVYILSSHDLVFPFSVELEEIHALSKKVKNEILKHAGEWIGVSEGGEDLHVPNTEWIFPELEDDGGDNEAAEDIGETAPGELDWTPSEAERQAIQLAHNNLGHPRQQDFARLLRRGGVRPEVVRWASRHFSCPACKHNQRPVARLPAGAPKTFSPNMVIGLDLFYMLHPVTHENEPWLHVVDWGTSFQTAERVQSKEAAHVFTTYSHAWVRLFGHAATIVVDAGTEFQGAFALACGQYGTLVHVIDTNTPWLNARTERSHALLRDQVALALEQVTPADDNEYLALVYHAVSMQNHHCNRGGYSPVQRVLGYTPPLPETILSDEVRPAMIAEGPLDAVRRSEHLRDVAREAWAKLASRSRLLQSLRAKNRGPLQSLQNGQRVWVWREGINSSRPGSWQGPGTIVCLTPTGAFVSLRGQLWKVNSRNLRLQEEEDQVADQMVSRYLTNLRHDLSSEGLRSQRKFVDCTRDATAPESRDQLPEPPQHDVHVPEPLQQVEQQEAMGSEGPEESRTRAVRLAPTEHPEAPPASRVRVQDHRSEQAPFRGAETLARQPRNLWTEIWIDGANGDTVGADDIKKGVVIPEQLPAHLRDLFVLGSRLKEEKMVLNSLRPLPEEAALEVEKNCPDCILPSRWLDVWKVKDEANQYPEAYGVPKMLHAKSRWILQGFRDPSLLALSRSTP